MGLRLRHTSLFLTYVLAPLCAISNFNYEQVNPRNFPAAMLLHGRLSFRKPVLPSPSSGLVHRAFPIVPIFARRYYVDIRRFELQRLKYTFALFRSNFEYHNRVE